MTYTNTWEPEGLYRKFTGSVDGDEILKSNFELHLNPNFQDIKYIINDFTEMTSHSIATGHTRAYATTDDIVSNTKGKLKIALLVTQAEHIDLAKIYCDQMEGKLFKCEIFDTIENARNWANNG